LHARGDGVRQNHGESARWYRLAADQGHADAQFNLGLNYDLGRGVAQDYGQAAQWYQRAADQGHVEARTNLGLLYRGRPRRSADTP
jgi:TPR repeat protein